MEKSLVKICQELVDELYEEENTTGLIEKRLGELAQKVDNYVSFYRYLDAQIDFLKREEEAIKSERARLENAQRRLKERAKYGLHLIDALKVKGERGSTISLRKTERVEIYDDAKLPKEFWRVKREPDRDRIKSAIKSGQNVPGAQIIEGEAVVFR